MEQQNDGKTIIIELKKNTDDGHNKEDDITLTHSSLFPVKEKKNPFFHNPILLAGILLFLLIVTVCLLISSIGDEHSQPENTTSDSLVSSEDNLPPSIPVGSLHVAGLSEATQVNEAITADFALLAEADALKAIAAKSANEKMYPASLTKIMTFLVAYDQLSNRLDKQLTLTKEIKNQYPEGYRTGIDMGDLLTVEQCMYAMLLESDTDAVLMLALEAAGSEAAFANLMNEKAEELGLVSTHFTNANGLHNKDHYTTPAEMAVIFAKALQNELFHNIITTHTYVTFLGYYENEQYKTYRMTFFNSTLVKRFENNHISTELGNGIKIIGGKTGLTDEAAYCQAALATDASGKEYIAILCHASSAEASANDTACLYADYIK